MSRADPAERRDAAVATIATSATLLAIALLHVWWLRANQRPPDWDQAWYLQYGLHIQRAFVRGGWAKLLDAVRSVPAKAPGMPLLFATVFALTDDLVAPVSWSVLLSAVGGFYVYLLGRRWLSPWPAAVAAVLSATMPLQVAMARTALVEAGLATAVVATLFHVEASERFRRWGHVAAVALWCALGVLLKVTFPAYVAVPALVASVTPWQAAGREWRRIAAGWIGIAAIAIAVAWPLWYGANWRGALAFAASASYGQIGAEYGRASLGRYLLQLATHGTSWWALAVVAALGFACAIRRCAGGRARLAWCASWVLPFVAAMLAGRNSEIRYAIGVLPGIALGAATLLEGIAAGSIELARRLAAGVAIPALALCVATSTGMLEPERATAGGPWWKYEGPPSRARWPAEDVARALSPGPSGRATLAIVGDSAELNHFNVMLLAYHMALPLRASDVTTASASAALAEAFNGKYLLVRAGSEPSSNRPTGGAAVVGAIKSGILPFALERTFSSPDGSTLGLFRHDCPAAAPGTVRPVATFEDGIDVRSIAVTSLACLPRVRVEWSASRGLESARLFVEVLDPVGRRRARSIAEPCAAEGSLDGIHIQDDVLLPDGFPGASDTLVVGFVDGQTNRAMRAIAVVDPLRSMFSETRVAVPISSEVFSGNPCEAGASAQR